MDISILFLIVAIGFFSILIIPFFRRLLLTKPFLHWFRRRLPALSEAEKEALHVGGVWWEGQIFSGHPDWSALLQLGKPQLTQEEQTFLDQQVETLCSMLDDWQIMQHERDLPT